MGKRKRSEAQPQLIPAACAEISAEASCLHAIKALEGVNSSKAAVLADKADKMQHCCAQLAHAAISVFGIRGHNLCTGLYRLGTQCRIASQ